jgi:molybdate transport system regulatory protein
MQHERFSLNGKIWLEVNQEKVLGPGRVELLEKINALGSIRQAALQMKMSYNQAWKIIKHLNDHFNAPLVISSRGGKSGGNATLTAEGLSLVKQYQLLQRKFGKFLAAHSRDMVIREVPA